MLQVDSENMQAITVLERDVIPRTGVYFRSFTPTTALLDVVDCQDAPSIYLVSWIDDSLIQMSDRSIATAMPVNVPDGFSPVFLVITSGGAFNAHWSLYVPCLREPARGKRLHATGDKRNGFVVEVAPDFDVKELQGARKFVFLSWIHRQYVRCTQCGFGICTMEVSGDELEAIAGTVPAPGPSVVCVSLGGPVQS
jgi:hypothetical protein